MTQKQQEVLPLLEFQFKKLNFIIKQLNNLFINRLGIYI
jgi:hypothetical protein